jgi:hypothetical protein
MAAPSRATRVDDGREGDIDPTRDRSGRAKKLPQEELTKVYVAMRNERAAMQHSTLLPSEFSPISGSQRYSD